MPLNKGYLTAKTDKASDETYTPAYAIKPLVKYVQDYMKRNKKETLTIWCPFDLINSKYVEVFSTIPNVKVIYTHIDNGENFFFYEPEEAYDKSEVEDKKPANGKTNYAAAFNNKK